MTGGAQDPYLNLNQHIRGLARSMLPQSMCEGRVLSTRPLRIRAGGLDLDADDLKVAWHLTDGWNKQLMAAMGVTVTAAPAPELQAGDIVLLLCSTDGQTYYVIDRIMEVGA